MFTKNKFRNSMIEDGLQAASSLKDSPLAQKLASVGITADLMEKFANDLQDLSVSQGAAKAAMIQTTAALEAKAEDFSKLWSSYSSLVRGLTPDIAIRKIHGVKSPSVRKGPMFHRAKKSTMVNSNGESASSNGSNGKG